MSLEINSEGRFYFHREGKGTKDLAVVDFLQTPDEPIVLTIDRAGRRETYRSPTLWHLLVTQPEVCREQVVPVMERLRRRWQIDRSVAAIEANLLRMAGESRPDRRQWDTLVEQLGDSRFAKREAADRQLREAGPFVMAYLAQLDLSRLDAEQQFRIRRIVSSMSRQTSDDDPEQAAASLAEDPTVWLGLCRRVPMRRRAVWPLPGLARYLASRLPLIRPPSRPLRAAGASSFGQRSRSGPRERRGLKPRRKRRKASEWVLIRGNPPRRVMAGRSVPETSPDRPPRKAPCCNRGLTTAAVLCAIMALALALRLLGAWCAYLIFDERAHWALAATINFSPCRLHLVSRTLDHPLLSIYVLKLGSLLLGTSDFALRLPYVLAGTATILPVYFLGKRAFLPKGRTLGRLAAGCRSIPRRLVEGLHA